MLLMKFNEVIKPKKIKRIESETNFSKFAIEPYTTGFALTVGNALRRVLLSSIEGTAVVAIKIDGVTNEFSALDGVLEDVVDIVLNVKQLKLNLDNHEPARVYIHKKGAGDIVAGDIQGDVNVVALDPTQHIMTVTDPNKEIRMELIVERSIGYVPSEEMQDRLSDEVGTIVVDASFSPIIRVAYDVESARVDQSTDYEKLVISITTDGSIKPEDAMGFAAKVVKDHFELFVNFKEPKEELDAPEASDTTSGISSDILNKSIEELDLSVRANNCLQYAEIKTIGALVELSEPEMLKIKNFGKKSLDEIKEILTELNLTLKDPKV